MIVRIALLACLIATAAAAPAAPAPNWAGTWRNGSNSVRIKAAPCGRGMCGTVVWASAKAQADVARRGRKLVGTQLFKDFRRGDDGMWHGEVYVPDIGKSFTGTITLTDRNTLTGSGCLFRNIGCKTQVWKRVR